MQADCINHQPPSGADIEVNLDGDADPNSASVRAGTTAGKHCFLYGPKQAHSIFHAAMLLCCIVELVSGDMTSAKVGKLANFIDQYNRGQAKLLGPVWLIGLMGTIPTSGHKGGMLEATIMHNAAQRLKLQQLLAKSDEPFFKTRLLQLIEGHHPSNLSSLDTYLKKNQRNNSMSGLLLDHLNCHTVASASSTATSDTTITTITTTVNTAKPCYTPYWDMMAPNSVACLNTCANFICTATMDRSLGIVKMFMHICLLMEVPLDVLGGHHLSQDLLQGLGINLVVDNRGNYGKEMVVELEAVDSQLAVVPFSFTGQQGLVEEELPHFSFIAVASAASLCLVVLSSLPACISSSSPVSLSPVLATQLDLEAKLASTLSTLCLSVLIITNISALCLPSYLNPFVQQLAPLLFFLSSTTTTCTTT
ncbi:uncharacterized protein UTRI_10265 [Ustilago trichophora]|uniref:Uncharacterized protein n=1 Tax=Ustilago trichophora TaxID=86804 RepID=A0A5C3EKM8_9BASI|nr:uncharacterized protein UTRI_10265 [Ustilago trichophora]